MTERIEATARDGTAVPISVLSRRDTHRWSDRWLWEPRPGATIDGELINEDGRRGPLFPEEKGDRWCIGFVEGFEALTTQFALNSLKRPATNHPRTDQRWGQLFEWHLAEEIEHRNVAFDIYDHLYGSYGFRVKMCWIAQHPEKQTPGMAFDTDERSMIPFDDLSDPLDFHDQR